MCLSVQVSLRTSFSSVTQSMISEQTDFIVSLCQTRCRFAVSSGEPSSSSSSKANRVDLDGVTSTTELMGTCLFALRLVGLWLYRICDLAPAHAILLMCSSSTALTQCLDEIFSTLCCTRSSKTVPKLLSLYRVGSVLVFPIPARWKPRTFATRLGLWFGLRFIGFIQEHGQIWCSRDPRFWRHTIHPF
jgi:hypothetical protein